MCFRPADATTGSGVNKCPECGKTIQVMGGVVLDDCPFCNVPLIPDIPTPTTPSAPDTPSTPSTPSFPPAPGTKIVLK